MRKQKMRVISRIVSLILSFVILFADIGGSGGSLFNYLASKFVSDYSSEALAADDDGDGIDVGTRVDIDSDSSCITGLGYIPSSRFISNGNGMGAVVTPDMGMPMFIITRPDGSKVMGFCFNPNVASSSGTQRVEDVYNSLNGSPARKYMAAFYEIVGIDTILSSGPVSDSRRAYYAATQFLIWNSMYGRLIGSNTTVPIFWYTDDNVKHSVTVGVTRKQRLAYYLLDSLIYGDADNNEIASNALWMYVMGPYVDNNASILGKAIPESDKADLQHYWDKVCTDGLDFSKSGIDRLINNNVGSTIGWQRLRNAIYTIYSKAMGYSSEDVDNILGNIYVTDGSNSIGTNDVYQEIGFPGPTPGTDISIEFFKRD